MKASIAVLLPFLAAWTTASHEDIHPAPLSVPEVQAALQNEGIVQSPQSLEGVLELFEHAVGAQRQLEAGGHSSGSVVGQDAVEIAASLNLPPGSFKARLVAAIQRLAQGRVVRVRETLPWETYFRETANLESDAEAARLFSRYGFSPVKISWEDIGRDEGSVWGSRISDVGIWGRQRAKELESARLMLTVRRDGNFRDKVLMVPSANIKLHRRSGGRLEEITLADRLRELNLLSSSGRFDKNVIVSNQFSIVPVPQKEHTGVDTLSFNFSIYPYGSTNYVIADTIEGSSEVVVGPGGHQLVYFNANGKKAPFTAARASDRKEVVAQAEEMKRAGLDVDVQRFYLIQIPLRHEATGIRVGNLGTPPLAHAYAMPTSAPPGAAVMYKKAEGASIGAKAAPGLEQVVVGHGEEEGAYFAGSGFSGKRADERVRVTVCYFVTPRGKLTEADMETFAKRFQEWDKKAIWGGSFVVPEESAVSSAP